MKNNTGNIYIGIAALLIITAVVSGGVIYLRDSGKKDPVTLSSEEPKKSVESGENEPILIQHNGEVYSLDGNKIIPVN